MSYSSQTKEELCRFEPDSVCCLLAELSGIVCAAGSVIYRGGGDKRLSIETENNAVARRAFRLLREVFDVQPQLVTLKRSRLGGRSAYRIEISGSEASFVLEGCGIEMGQRRGVPREITVRKCCRMSFLRGVFLACGSVTDPEKDSEARRHPNIAYSMFSRPKGIQVTLNGTYTFDATLRDDWTPQIVVPPYYRQPVHTIKIRINSIYRGTGTSDTYIGILKPIIQ